VPAPNYNMSTLSSPLLPESMFYSADFMLGAGMVILQPATERFVVVYESARKYYFLPKGRKDVGESLEQAALREAYEEVRALSSPLAHVRG
jgi:8-oxo-dGTP pyrophosphatase MutT (NUDIX family)